MTNQPNPGTRPSQPLLSGDGELVERLREAGCYCGALSDVNHLFGEAADHIVALNAEITRKNEALESAKARFDGLYSNENMAPSVRNFGKAGSEAIAAAFSADGGKS